MSVKLKIVAGLKIHSYKPWYEKEPSRNSFFTSQVGSRSTRDCPRGYNLPLSHLPLKDIPGPHEIGQPSAHSGPSCPSGCDAWIPQPPGSQGWPQACSEGSAHFPHLLTRALNKLHCEWLALFCDLLDSLSSTIIFFKFQLQVRL